MGSSCQPGGKRRCETAREKCCPRLDEADWNRREWQWDNKPFYKTKYRSIFHIPINIGRVVTKAMADLESRDLTEEPPIMLSKEESMFSSTLLISLNRSVGDLATETLSGKYISHLFEGSYRQTPKWVQQVQQHLTEQGKQAQELLFWYVTCPKCAKEYGSAQTVIFAKVD